jgi:hypothetical protein
MSDLQIIQFDKVTGLGSVSMGLVPRKISGLTKLVQIVALTFLKNPGRDVLDISEGSGLRGDVGQYNFSTSDEIKLLAIQRAKDVEKQILDRQPTSADPTEKLKKLQILDVAADAATSSAVLRVQVFNEAGDTADILV